MTADIVLIAATRWEATRRSLENLTPALSGDSRILLVGPREPRLEELPPNLRLRILEVDHEPGLALAARRGLGIASAHRERDVVLVDAGLAAADSGWLDRLLACAASAPDAGVVGCRLRTSRGLLLHAGWSFSDDTFRPQAIGQFERDIGQFPETRPVAAVPFSAVLLTRAVVDRLGGFEDGDDGFFHEADFCFRARRERFAVLVCGDVTFLQGDVEHEPLEQQIGSLQRGRYRFRDRWHREIGEKYTQGLHWQSLLTGSTGYAESSRELVKAIDAAGVRITYSYLYGPGTSIPGPESEELGDPLLKIIRHRCQREPPPVSVAFGQGDVFFRSRGGLKVGFTMIETDRFPKEWVRQGSFLEEVWVPTQFNAAGLRESGLARPIFVIPLGIDPARFHPDIQGFPNPMGEFVFLSNFEWSRRKNPETLLRAFSEEFRSDEPVRLVCKVLNRDRRISIASELAALGLRRGGGRISYLFNREFPSAELGSFYRSGDCYVSASSGEGWDLPLLEAMACGLPSIATDWGGHTEFVDDRNSYRLRIRGLVAAAGKPQYEGLSWSDPDPDHLRFLLRHVYEHRDEARAKGKVAARDASSRWTWKQSAAKIVDRLRELTS